MNLQRIFSLRRKDKAEADEPLVFTRHVQALESGAEIGSREIEEVLAALGAALRNELRKRGLWESPPSYLGVYGAESWESGALEELLLECYSYIFVSRQRSLAAQLKVKPNIDGLVFRNIHQLVSDRQKEHDPLGAQVFAVLQSAVRLALDAGELRLFSGDERIRNDTVLGFAGAENQPLRGAEAFPPLVARWNDDLLPDLVTARGRNQDEVVERLRAHLLGLEKEGIAVFRFKDLIDPLKADVRARWVALLDRSQGETAGGDEEGEVVRLAWPETKVEEREVYRKLVDCVLGLIRTLEANEKTRRYLETLFQFVRLQVADRRDDDLSLRQLAEQLKIPRERIQGLYQTLGDFLARCKSAISGETAVRSLKGNSTHGS